MSRREKPFRAWATGTRGKWVSRDAYNAYQREYMRRRRQPGWQRKSAVWSTDRIEAFQRLYMQGMTLAEIERVLQMPFNTATYWRRKLGLPQRRRTHWLMRDRMAA